MKPMPESAPPPPRPRLRPSRAERPYLVGITGPIGSGKSLFARLLADRHGAVVLDADRLGHEVIAPGGAAQGVVLARFGDAIRDRDGAIDRTRLAAIVFRDPSALAALETISHPLILAAVGERVSALKTAGYAGMILLDAAVLPRWLDRLHLAALILVQAAAEVRLSRLVQRGWDLGEARRRIAVQESMFGPDLAADWSIDNSGTTESLEQTAAAVGQELADHFGGPREE